MPMGGSKPKPRNQIRHRVPPVVEWRDFPNVPNPDPPPLPPAAALRRATGGTLTSWPAFTKRWWRNISTMPHTVIWSEGDWVYAIETAFMHARFCSGEMDRTMTELRRRTIQMGATWEGRRELRIRYVDADGASNLERSDDPAVTAMADYRKAAER